MARQLFLLVHRYLAQGIDWYAPFYFYGVAGIIWYMVWLWLSFEKPAKHPSISPREQLYIEQSLGDSKAKQPTIKDTPWLKVRRIPWRRLFPFSNQIRFL